MIKDGEKNKMKMRKISNKELADLPPEWENSKVDTKKYYQNVMEAYEVSIGLYMECKRDGGLCQKYSDRYYIA